MATCDSPYTGIQTVQTYYGTSNNVTRNVKVYSQFGATYDTSTTYTGTDTGTSATTVQWANVQNILTIPFTGPITLNNQTNWIDANNRDLYTAQTYGSSNNIQINAAPVSEEQRALMQKVWEEHQRREAVILKRADRLLRDQLISRQRQTFDKLGFFDVKSKSNPDRAYRIPESGMIVMFEKGKPVEQLCIYPVQSLPKGDKLLTLKFLAEAEENELLKTSNRHKLNGSRLERLPLMM